MRFQETNSRLFPAAVAIATISLLVACTITQQINPANVAPDAEVCIIENNDVREGFLAELQNSLGANGYRYRMLPSTATTSDCRIVLTYVARWSWDLTIYMAYARLQVFESGQPAGDALYDATQGGGNMSKFIDAEPKIRELVTELLPPFGP
jgi:hypothetical protein